MMIELHSGIPATKTAQVDQERMLEKLEADLKKKEIHYLKATSHGELSKYYRKPGFPMFVRYDNWYSEPEYIPLEKCTDLFQKYSEQRRMVRIYVSPENLKKVRAQGKGERLKYEE
jgi:hypothetical protein